MGMIPVSVGAQIAARPARAAGAVLWKRTDLARMRNVGILPEKYELLDGDIINKMGQDITHRRAVSYLFGWLAQVWGADHVLMQAAVDVSPRDNPANAPEPDLVALRTPVSSLAGNPGPGMVDLVVEVSGGEVSGGTLVDDLTRKKDLYARAGFPEYWVFDVSSRRLFLHRKPIDGSYQGLLERWGSAEVATLAHPEHRLRPEKLLA